SAQSVRLISVVIMSSAGTELKARQARPEPALVESGAVVAPDANPNASLVGQEKARYVSRMFGRIAKRYDFMNTIMSFGQDAMWRRYVARRANVRSGALVLDVATGTGRIAQELARKGATVVALDFSLDMMLQ